jgi:hypothetical protein
MLFCWQFATCHSPFSSLFGGPNDQAFPDLKNAISTTFSTVAKFKGFSRLVA